MAMEQQFSTSTTTKLNMFGIGVAVSSAAVAPMGNAALAQGLPSWTGFYIGGQAGLASSSVRSTHDYSVGGKFPFSVNKATNHNLFQGTLGTYFGFNKQLGNVLAGVEADINARFGSGNLAILSFGFINGLGPSFGLNVSSNWEGSIRGRLGYLVNPRTLIYGTAGISWANFKFSGGDSPILPGSLIAPTWKSLSGVRSGFVFGGGVEVAINENWRAKGEILHAIYNKRSGFAASGEDFYRVHNKISTTTMRIGIARAF